MTERKAGRRPPDLGERYVVESFLGEGSMGRVWRAWDCQLARRVAVKVLRSSDPTEQKRFKREARAQASIVHEHVCRVFDVGECGAGAFLAMQLVAGETLQSIASTLSLDDKVRLMEQVARAVQAAHMGGVVHRDLNPHNIMVERRHDDELHAYVLDFGIARPPGEWDDSHRPATAGIPAYMAPEQLAGEDEAVGPAADVYAVGATLYAVLAEQSPYFGPTREATVAMVLHAAPLRIGWIVPGVPEALETIVETAMARTPNQRYADAACLADDLRRWRQGLPVRGGKRDVLVRTYSWLRARWPVVTAAAVGAAIVATAGVAVLWAEHRRERREASIAACRSEVEQIDRILRRARMMPTHDTAGAEAEVRRRLQELEKRLARDGRLGSGPVSYALGFGHLMLREFDPAEEWLRAAVAAGSAEPEVTTALGTAVAMQILQLELDGERAPPERRDEAVRLLSDRGPHTETQDLFHLALSLAIRRRWDEALETARESSLRTPWLYEARQLEGDILLDRALQLQREGDVEAAVADVRRAANAYDRGLEVARSDPWLLEGLDRCRRLVRELTQSRDLGNFRDALRDGAS